MPESKYEVSVVQPPRRETLTETINAPTMNLFSVTRESDSELDQAIKKRQTLQAKYRKLIHAIHKIYEQDTPQAKILNQIVFQGYSGKQKLVNNQTRVTGVFLIESDEMTLFAMGTEIYISTAQLNSTMTANCLDKLAGLLSHEINHIEADHEGKQDKRDIDRQNKELEKRIAGLSLPRMHEADADLAAPSRMDTAGYNPTAYRDSLIAASSIAATSMAHGDIHTRLAAQYGLLSNVDFKNSSIPFTTIPNELHNLAEKKDLFALSVDMHDSELRQMLALFDIDLVQLYLDYTIKLEIKFMHGEPEITLTQVDRLMQLCLAELQKREFPQLANLNKHEQALVSALLLRKFGKFSASNYDSYEHTVKQIISNIKVGEPGLRKQIAKSVLESLREKSDWQTVAEFVGQIDNQSGDYSRVFWAELINSSEMHHSGPGIYFKKLCEDFPEYFTSKIAFSNPSIEFNSIDYAAVYEFFCDLEARIRPSSRRSRTAILSSYLDSEIHHLANNLRSQLESNRSSEFAMHTFEVLRANASKLKHLILAQLTSYLKVIESEIAATTVDRYWTQEQSPYWAKQLISRTFHEYFGGREEFSAEETSITSETMLALMEQTTIYARYLSLLNTLRSSGEGALAETLKVTGVKEIGDLLSLVPGVGVSALIVEEYSRAYLEKASLEQLIKDAGEINSSTLTRNGETYVAVDSLERLSLAGDGTDLVRYRTSKSNNEYVLLHLDEVRMLIYFSLIRSKFYRSTEADGLLLLENILDIAGPKFTTRTGILSLVFIFEWISRQELDRNRVYNHPTILRLRDEMLAQVSDMIAQNKLAEALSAAKSFINQIDGGLHYDDWLIGGEAQLQFILPLVELGMKCVLRLSDSAHLSVSEVNTLVSAVFNHAEGDSILYQWETKQAEKFNGLGEAVEFLKKLIAANRINLHAFLEIQKKLIHNRHDLTQVEEFLSETRDRLITDGNLLGTKAIVVDMVGERALQRLGFDFFEAAVTSYENDANLREHLGGLWYEVFCSEQNGMMEQRYKLGFIQTSKGPAIRIVQHKTGEFVSFESLMDKFYDNMTEGEKQYIARKMLYGDNGIIRTKEGRTRLYSLLMKHGLKGSDSQEEQRLVQEVFASLLSIHTETPVIDPVAITEPLIKLIGGVIFRRPAKPDNNLAAKKIVHLYNKDFKRREGFVPGFSHSFYRETEATRVANEKAIEAAKVIDKIDINMAKTLLAFDPSRAGTLSPAYASGKRYIEAARDHLRHILGVSSQIQSKEHKPLDPTVALLTVLDAQAILGTRLKQVSPIFIQWSAAHLETIEKSYYRTDNQTKFTALTTLKHEAHAAGEGTFLYWLWENMSQIWDLGDSGSGFKVLKVQVGEQYFAVKVAIPNAIHAADQTRDMMKAIAQDIRNHQKVISILKPSVFKRINFMIGKMHEWSVADLLTTDYTEQSLLAKQNEGKEYSGMRVKVPLSTPTGTHKIRVMPWIEGNHLFQDQEGQPRTSTDAYRRVAISNFLDQISRTSGTRAIHADFTFGQMLAVGNLLYILDSEYSLAFDEDEQNFFELFLSEEKNSALMSEFIAYLGVIGGFKLSNRLKAVAKKYTSSKDLLMELVDQDIEDIPVKWLLLAKGINFVRAHSV